VQIPDVGHFLMLEVPETFNGHLQAVLEELAPSGSR
jgi:pimeloyl-ACP methyl ester carboxylesterase